MVSAQHDGSSWYKDDQAITVRLQVYCQLVSCESQWCFASPSYINGIYDLFGPGQAVKQHNVGICNIFHDY